MFTIERGGSPRRGVSFSRELPKVQQFHEENGKKWFSEVEAVNPKMLPGMSAGIEVNEIIASRNTGLHNFLILNTTAYGKVLAVDGTVQVTQKDCWTYYEMCTHLPLACHLSPRKVLIVGGLDASGLAKEILKHESVESVVHCEEDQEMVDLLRKHFQVADFDYNNPKFEYVPMDAKKYLKQHVGEFDIIITDFSLPSLPYADGCFGESYFELVKNALRVDGVSITLSWGIWIELRSPTKVLVDKMKWLRNLFPSVDYYGFSIPSCTSGLAGNIICSKRPGKNFKLPLRPLSEKTVQDWKLRYYNTDIHTASFALPQFAKEQLFPAKRRAEST